jgi:hypothetical protein
MRNRPYTLAYGVMLMLETAGLGVAQDGGQRPQHASSFSISTRRNRLTRNSPALRRIWS